MSKIPNVENEVSASSPEMNIPSQYDNVDWGAKVKVTNRKTTTKSSGTDGTIYGSKAIMTKEDKVTFANYLIQENSDLSAWPTIIVDEIRKNIRTGAKDLNQKWKNALELTNKALEVASIQPPTPSKKAAWNQYEELIRFSVQQLAATRGLKGDWRSSELLVKEAAALTERVNDLSKRRFFVEMPGEAAREVEGTNLDEIVDAISNKIRNTRHVLGTKVRVEERTKDYAVLAVFVNDVKRERIVIKRL